MPNSTDFAPPITVTDTAQTVAVARSLISDIYIYNAGPDIVYMGVSTEDTELTSGRFTRPIFAQGGYAVELNHTGDVSVICAAGETATIHVTKAE